MGRDDKLRRRLLWSLVLGVVLYAGIALLGDVRSLARSLQEFRWGVFLAALGMSLANYGVRFAKWHYYLGRIDVRVPVLDSAVVFVAGLTMAVTPGKVGEVMKSVLLKERFDVPVARSAPVVLAERLTDLFGLFVIASFGIGVFDYGRFAFAATLLVLAGAIIVVQFPPWVRFGLDLLERLPFGGRARPRLEEAYESTRALLGLRPLAVATLLSAVSWSMEALAFYWILGALGADQVSVNLAFFIYAMTTILGAVSFLPGGLGVTEASMIGALLLFSVFPAEGPATAATYLIRLATLWFAVGLGVVGLAAFRAMKPPDSAQMRE